MSNLNPIETPKEQYAHIINTISSENSAVGIDAQYTHAIIIKYLQQINERLNTLEELVKK